MPTIELNMTVGPQKVLRAAVTTESEKLKGLKLGQEVRVKIATELRSLPSNALSHQWYKDVSLQTQDAPHYVRNFCKLHYGVPILLAESEKFRNCYNVSIRGSLTYEQKLAVMDLLDVTSLMNKDQMNRYLNTMQQEYANRGVILQTPKDAEYARWVEQQARV